MSILISDIIRAISRNTKFRYCLPYLGGSEEELQQLTERLEKTAAGNGLEISTNKSKILVNIIKPWPLLRENKAISFPTKIKLQITRQYCTMDVRAAADWATGETNPCLCKQVPREDAWRIIRRTQNEQIYMARGQYPCRMSWNFCCQASQVIMVRPLGYAARNRTTGNSRW